MKNLLSQNRFNLLIILLFAVFVALSFWLKYLPGQILFQEHFYNFFMEMILFLPVMFLLIGLGDVWISREKIEKHIGNDSGIKGIVFVVFLSMAQVGPLYGAFPVAALLCKKGASIRNVFIYIGAFCTVKIPMLTFEIGFLGWKFSLLRTLFALPFIILIALIMERILKGKPFEIKQIY